MREDEALVDWKLDIRNTKMRSLNVNLVNFIEFRAYLNVKKMLSSINLEIKFLKMRSFLQNLFLKISRL
jgi:hypothetical protein